MTAPLDALHGFYQPPSPAWTPQTVGWYCVFAAAAIAALWILARRIRRWRFNRYRREALNELKTLAATELSALLKRTALSAWPRERVASLSGPEWLQFLDDALKDSGFKNAPGNRIEDIAFGPAALSAEEEKQLRDLTAQWIRSHHVRA